MPNRARVLLATLAALTAALTVTACTPSPQGENATGQSPTTAASPMSAVDAALLNIASTPHTFHVEAHYGDTGALIHTIEGEEKPGAVRWRDTGPNGSYESRVISPDIWQASFHGEALEGTWGHWSSPTTASAALDKYNPVISAHRLISATGGLNPTGDGHYRATLAWIDLDHPAYNPILSLASGANIAAAKGPIQKSVLEAVIVDGRLIELTATTAAGETAGAEGVVTLKMTFTPAPDITVTKPLGPITELTAPVDELPA